MGKLILSLALILGAATVARASEEQIHNWKTATLVADTSLFGEVAVTASADAGGRVKSLSVKVKGKTIVVPDKWIATLPDLPLASIQVRSERGYDKDPWLYVYFQTPSTPQVQVHISFQSGKLAGGSITTIDAKGNRKYEQRKAP